VSGEKRVIFFVAMPAFFRQIRVTGKMDGVENREAVPSRSIAENSL
jgi:hypothetical protein